MIRSLLLAALLGLGLSAASAEPPVTFGTPPAAAGPTPADFGTPPNAAAPLDDSVDAADAARASAPPPTQARARDAVAAPLWSLPDAGGRGTVSLENFRGKVVILDFFTTWCPPCQQEMPGFVYLQQKYGDQGLAVIGVSLDAEGPAAVRPFLQAYHVNFPVVMGNPQVAAAYGGIAAIPTSFLIDRLGNIVAREGGYTDRSQFEGQILPLLAQKVKKK
ncbi:MAG: TlpA disulfide reductase family protein [Verrucomicrobium sp.]|nr:TlpA disulfide reductase family protein [Verrucomicrobium sp.]